MKRTAIEEARTTADASGLIHPESSFSDHVLVLETCITDLLAILSDERPPHPQRLRMAFDGVADLFRQLTEQQIIELNEGRSDSEAYRKLEALKPQLQSVLDHVRPLFMQSQAAPRAPGAARDSSGTPTGRPLDTEVGSAEDVAMEARLTKLESCVEQSAKVLDTMQKRMDDGFRETRAEMAAGFREVRGEASANFRVLVGIQVTTLIAVLTMLAKMANIF